MQLPTSCSLHPKMILWPNCGRNRSAKDYTYPAEAALQKSIAAVNLTDSVSKIKKHINDNPMNVVIVVDDQKRLQGVISQKDLEKNGLSENPMAVEQILRNGLANYSSHDSL